MPNNNSAEMLRKLRPLRVVITQVAGWTQLSRILYAFYEWSVDEADKIRYRRDLKYLRLE